MVFVPLMPVMLFFMNPGITSGDALFLEMDYPAAIREYENILKMDPESVEVSWRLAMTYFCMGEVAETADRLHLYKKAEEYARRCVEQDPARSECHSWLAASLGGAGMFQGTLTMLRLQEEIVQALDTALELNPHDDVALSLFGTVYRVLGGLSSIHRRLAALFFSPLPEGGYAEGEAALRKAADLAPQNPRHVYELGRLYSQWGRDKDAKEAFEKALSIPPLVATDLRHIDIMKRYLATSR